MDNSIIKLRKELLNLVEDKFDLKDYEIPNDEVV